MFTRGVIKPSFFHNLISPKEQSALTDCSFIAVDFLIAQNKVAYLFYLDEINAEIFTNC